ncbi:MAG: hypothetical protein AAF533_12800 [Acidobacteriota bacterium]
MVRCLAVVLASLLAPIVTAQVPLVETARHDLTGLRTRFCCALSLSVDGDVMASGAVEVFTATPIDFHQRSVVDAGWERLERDVGTGWVAVEGDRLVAAGRETIRIHERDVGGANAWGLAAEVELPRLRGVFFDPPGDIALSGDRFAVSIPSIEEGRGSPDNVGWVFVYERTSEGSWGQVAELSGSDCVPTPNLPGCRFGHSVALSGEDLVITAQLLRWEPARLAPLYFHSKDAGGADAWGRVATWLDPAWLRVETAEIDGDVVVAGGLALTEDGVREGRVQVFERDGDAWSETLMLSPTSAPVWPSDFGMSVAVRGDRFVVGSRGDDGDFGPSGGVHVWERGSTGWEHAGVARPLADQPHFGLGFTVALSDESVVAGSYDSTSRRAQVHVFEQPESDCDDALDGDGDGDADCLDTDCASEPACDDEDADGDGRRNVDDCSPADPGAWGDLPPVEGLRISLGDEEPSPLVFSWSELSDDAGPTFTYQLAWLPLDALPGERFECLASSAAPSGGTTWELSALRGSAFFLVRARNSCSSSVLDWGTDSLGLPRNACP